MKAANGLGIEPTDLQCSEGANRKSNDVDLISLSQSGNLIRESLKVVQSINGSIDGKSFLTNHPESIPFGMFMKHFCLGDSAGNSMKVDDSSSVMVTE